MKSTKSDFGLPQAIRTDNGVPFASGNALFGLTRLSVWRLRLGISLQQQERVDDFIGVYNNERPHQALGSAYPGDLYTPSARIYEPPGEPDYPFHPFVPDEVLAMCPE